MPSATVATDRTEGMPVLRYALGRPSILGKNDIGAYKEPEACAGCATSISTDNGGARSLGR